MKRRNALLATLTLALLFGACSDDSTSPQGRYGTLEIAMIDAPGAYDQVNIVIDSVQAHINSGDSVSGWYTLNRTPKTYDLLKLVNGAEAVIGTAKLLPGKYSQIRLHLGTGSNVVVNGVTNLLVVPSGAQSGLKLNVHAEIEPDRLYKLVLDFDVNSSIKTSGSSSNPTYRLQPVIKVVTTASTGIISGSITPVAAKPFISAIMGNDTTTTAPDTTGAFKLRYLAQGTYSVVVMPQDTTYRNFIINNVNVTADGMNSLGTITLIKK